MELRTVTTEQRISEKKTKNKTAGETDRDGETMRHTFGTLPIIIIIKKTDV